MDLLGRVAYTDGRMMGLLGTLLGSRKWLVDALEVESLSGLQVSDTTQIVYWSLAQVSIFLSLHYVCS